MKSNFILQPSNVGEFVKRFNKLLNVTEFLSVQTFYNRNEVNNIFISMGKKNELVLKSIKSYFDKNKFEVDTYPSSINKSKLNFLNSEGIILRHHFDACSVYYWGQKFRFTPTQIKTIGYVKMSKFFKSQAGSTIIQIESDVDKAKNEIEYSELSAKQYYADIMDDIDYDYDY